MRILMFSRLPTYNLVLKKASPPHNARSSPRRLFNIIQYYNNRNTSVYAMLLDASQAFDCLHYTKLFRMLQDKGICPLLCKLLILMHRDQSVRIRWGSTYTNTFSVSNGVKQGGSISPVLFSIYADYILHGLKSNGLGCYVGAVFAGALAYADKIILLSPCRSVLNDMLDNAAMLSADLNISNSILLNVICYIFNRDRKVILMGYL